MRTKEKLLTDLTVRHAGPGTHNDGNGLTLRVGKGGSRSWVLRYTFNGQPANVDSLVKTRFEEVPAL